MVKQQQMSTLITFISLTGQACLPYSTRLNKHAEYNLPFIPRGKALLPNKSMKSPNLHYQLLILVEKLSNTSSIVIKTRKHFHNFQTLAIQSNSYKPCISSVSSFPNLWHFNVLSSFNLPLILLTATFLMHPTTANLTEDGITAYRLSTNSTRKFDFYWTFSSIYTITHHFCLLNIYSQPFWLQYSFPNFQSVFQVI